MCFNRDPNRSPSPSDDENDHYDSGGGEEEEGEEQEAVLEAAMAEKEDELKRTQELINERQRQVEATLAQIRRINALLEQFENIAQGNSVKQH